MSFIAYCDYPPELIAQGSETLLEGAQKGAAANFKARLVKTTDISLGTIPGREAELEVPTEMMVLRFYLAGNRFYQLGISGARLRSDSPEVKRLFDSFKILR